VGSGIGAAALQFAESHARRLKLGGVWLRAMAYRDPVVQFYLKRGYRALGGEELALPNVVAEKSAVVVLVRAFAGDEAHPCA
jgi:hypothetical protein